MKKPGIRELADACGVSKTTASHALSGRGRVSEATARRVRACAQRLGYAPDAHAVLMAQRRVSARKTVELGLIMTPTGPARSMYNLLKHHLATYAAGQGFRVSLHEVVGTAQAVRVCRMLYHRGAAGVFIPAVPEFLAIPREVLAGLCVVVLGRSTIASAYCSVHHDIFETTRAACLELLARGYRRILPVMVPHHPPIRDDWERLGAVHAARMEVGLRAGILAPVSVARHSNLEPLVSRIVPDAVIGFNDLEFFMLMENGVSVPDDVGYLALHAHDEWCSGFVMPGEGATVAAIEQMSLLIRRDERGVPEQARHVSLARNWNEGLTLRPRVKPEEGVRSR